LQKHDLYLYHGRRREESPLAEGEDTSSLSFVRVRGRIEISSGKKPAFYHAPRERREKGRKKERGWLLSL